MANPNEKKDERTEEEWLEHIEQIVDLAGDD
jgi:hypothetical protein